MVVIRCNHVLLFMTLFEHAEVFHGSQWSSSVMELFLLRILKYLLLFGLVAFNHHDFSLLADNILFTREFCTLLLLGLLLYVFLLLFLIRVIKIESTDFGGSFHQLFAIWVKIVELMIIFRLLWMIKLIFMIIILWIASDHLDICILFHKTWLFSVIGDHLDRLFLFSVHYNLTFFV